MSIFYLVLLSGTSFVEKYDVDSQGTKVEIKVNLQSKGISF